MCDFAGVSLAGLRQHIENKHERIRYDCDQCEYVAPTKSQVRTHTYELKSIVPIQIVYASLFVGTYV